MSTKKIFLSLIVSFFVLTPFICNAEGDWLSSGEDILFYRKGCQSCSEIDKYIEKNDIKIPVQKIEISNPENATKFNEFCERMGVGIMERKIPYLHAEGECYIGEDQIISYLETCKDSEGKEGKEDCIKETNKKNSFTIFALISAALVDAINPCAFAVLLILMSTLMASGRPTRALFSGFSFTLSIFISYLMIGLGIYSFIASAEFSLVFNKIIGVLAILVGLFNLKDYLWYGRWFLMEVPRSWRPKMKALIASITSPVGAFFVGLLISLFLLPCTSGPYFVIISMLGQEATYWNAFWLLVFYNVIFISPMLGITLGAYFGMDLERADLKREKNIKMLHLIAGIIMLAMGVMILI